MRGANCRPVSKAPHRLAVDRNLSVAADCRCEPAHETGEGLSEASRIELAEQGREGVVRRNAVRQLQDLAKHLLLLISETPHV